MILDVEAIRRRRAEAGLSHRAVASALGVSSSVIKRLETGTNHPDLTVGQLARLADLLAVNVADLITKPRRSPDGPDPSPADETSPDDDAAVVGSLLATTKVLTPTTAVAEATGWPVPRVHAALEVLADRLPATGQQLRRHQHLVALARAVTDDDADRIRAALRIHLARNGVSAGEVRLLRRIHAGTVPKVLGNADSVTLGVLANAQLIASDDGATWGLTDDVRYSLLLD